MVGETTNSVDLRASFVQWSMAHSIFIKLSHLPHIHNLDLDQRQYGTRWRTSTRLVSSRIDPLRFSRLEKICKKDPEGRCGRTHQFHIQLRGTHPSGKPWTSLASAYPANLANDIVWCLLEPFIQKYPSSDYGRNRSGQLK